MKKSKSILFAAVLAGVGLMTAFATESRAGFTITLGTQTGSGPFTYSYTATIPTGDQINSGDFFRIYDFAGYVDGTVAAPAGWTASTALTNPTPPPNVFLSHGDDPTIPNLIFTYNGAPIVGGSSISGFTAQSIYSISTNLKNFAGRDTKATGATAGSPVDSVGDVYVPAAVPEPTSLISGGIGVILLGLGYGVRNRRKSRV